MEESGTDRVERRLAAILAADVVGYSRLMGIDEEGDARPAQGASARPLSTRRLPNTTAGSSRPPATDRCSPEIAPGCLGTKANPVDLFDETGKEIRSFGGGLLVWPHGIHVDRDGNVWVTDARVASAEERNKFPGEEKKGSVVIKFSPDGKVLMTLGKPGVKGDPQIRGFSFRIIYRIVIV